MHLNLKVEKQNTECKLITAQVILIFLKFQLHGGGRRRTDVTQVLGMQHTFSSNL